LIPGSDAVIITSPAEEPDTGGEHATNAMTATGVLITFGIFAIFGLFILSV
jgi:hypothetical protein